MKKILYTAVLALMATAASAQVCTIDNSIPFSGGLYTSTGIPKVLASGVEGTPYVDYVQVHAPKDTIANVPPFGNVTLYFCSFVVESVSGLPAGLTLEAGPTAGPLPYSWPVSHVPGTDTRGCIKISGTPTAAFCNSGDSIVVIANATVATTAPVAPNYTCTAATLPLPTQVTYKMFLCIAPVGIDDAASFKMSLAPNPTEGVSTLKFNLSQSAEALVTVTDMAGRVVSTIHNGRLFQGEQMFDIDTENLANGMYMVSVNIDNGHKVLTQKLSVN